MSQQQQPLPTVEQSAKKDNTSNLLAFCGTVRVFDTEIDIWHFLPEEVFFQAVRDFNEAHPKLMKDKPSVTKRKIMKFLNSKFKLNVCYKSKIAIINAVNYETRKQLYERAQSGKL